MHSKQGSTWWTACAKKKSLSDALYVNNCDWPKPISKKDVQEKTDIKCKIKRWTKDKFRKLLNLIKTRTTTHLRQLLPHKSMSLENETLAKFWERGYWSHQSLRKSCWGDHLRCRISPWIRQSGFLVLTPGVAKF